MFGVQQCKIIAFIVNIECPSNRRTSLAYPQVAVIRGVPTDMMYKSLIRLEFIPYSRLARLNERIMNILSVLNREKNKKKYYQVLILLNNTYLKYAIFYFIETQHKVGKLLFIAYILFSFLRKKYDNYMFTSVIFCLFGISTNCIRVLNV